MSAPTLESTGKLRCKRCGGSNEVVLRIIPSGRYDFLMNDPSLYRLYFVRCHRLRGFGALRNLWRGHAGRGISHTDDPIAGTHQKAGKETRS